MDIHANDIEPMHTDATDAGDSRLDLNMYSQIPTVIIEQRHEGTESAKHVDETSLDDNPITIEHMDRIRE